MLETHQPKSVVIHERFVVKANVDSVPDVSDIFSVVFPPEVKVFPYNSASEIKLPVESRWLEVVVPTKSLTAVPLISMETTNSGKILIGRVSGELKRSDYRYDLVTKNRRRKCR